MKNIERKMGNKNDLICVKKEELSENENVIN